VVKLLYRGLGFSVKVSVFEQQYQRERQREYRQCQYGRLSLGSFIMLHSAFDTVSVFLLVTPANPHRAERVGSFPALPNWQAGVAGIEDSVFLALQHWIMCLCGKKW
jgi:hypothetical protein